MRVAVNGWFWNQPHTGSGQYTRQILVHLLEIAPQHEYIVVTPETSFPVSSPETATSASSLSRKPGLRKAWFEQITFPRACRSLKADLAHVPYWGSPLSPSVPTVVTIHDIIPLLLPEYRGGIRVRTYTGLVQSAAEKAALVLTDSEASRRDILTHLDLSESRVRVVHLATHTTFSPNPDPKDEMIRAHYELPDEYVLYLSGFDARKNLVGLLQAWTFAEGAIGEFTPLVIAGRIPQHSTFSPDPRKIAEALDISPATLCFPGPVEEAHKPAVYRGAVCFVFPSRYEGFGLTPLEALSCGVPVVGSNSSSIPEVVGDAGVLVPPDDTRNLAGSLIALATEPEMRDQLGARAVAQAARFSWDKTAQQTLNAYQDALS